MHLRIRERFSPFTHIPGTYFHLPGSHEIARVFPTRFERYEGDVLLEVNEFDYGGPVSQFTATMDLERGLLFTTGRTERGFFREELYRAATPSPKERLSLGVQKKQEIEQILKRQDLKEILPFWLRLGAWESSVVAPDEIFDFLPFFRAGFRGFFAERGFDSDYQGFTNTKWPRPLLEVGAAAIRSLFFRVENECVKILPALPTLFPAGRFLSLTIRPGIEIDIAWTKKTLHCIVVRSSQKETIQFLFPPHLKRYRVRKNERDRGVVKTCGATLQVEPGILWLTNFEI